MLNRQWLAPAPRRAALAGLAVVLGLLATPAARAQENADCLACHGEKDFATERKGHNVSLYVGEKAFAASIHGKLECVNCHADLEGKELPHDEPLKTVSCGTCHDAEQQQHAKSLHGKAIAQGDPLAPRCETATARTTSAAKDPPRRSRR